MFLEVLGVRVYYEQHGASGPNVLLLHGWGASVALWEPVTEALAQYARVTVIDFPGHGQSGRPPEPWGAKEFAEMTALVIERLAIQGCHVVAHSHGGRVTLRLALDRPELLGKLVLTGSAGLRGKPTMRQQLRSKIFRWLRGCCDGLEKLGILGAFPGKAKDALRRRFGSPDYNALDEEMRRTFVKLVNTDMTADLPRVRASTLLIWGDRDTETPLWMGRLMEFSIPDAGLVVLEGGSHFAYLEQLGLFLRVVKQFLLGG